MRKDKKVSLECFFNHVIERDQFCFSYSDGETVHLLNRATDSHSSWSSECFLGASEVKKIIDFLTKFLDEK